MQERFRELIDHAPRACHARPPPARTHGKAANQGIKDRADRRPAGLVAALVAILLVILAVPAFSHYFSLVPNALVFVGVAVFLPPWFLALRTIRRRDLLRRILGLRDPHGTA